MTKKAKFILIAIVVLVVLSLVGKYNKLVSLDESTQTARSQVENVYQRRADLIPNLVSTVKGFATHETDVFVSVTEARASATKTNVNINDAQEMAAYSQSQGSLSSALSRLLVTVEAYPQLKSDQNFLALQSQLEGTENRITVERKKYNDTAKAYNIYVRRFPTNLVASIFGFEKAQLFETDKANETAPVVGFE